MAPEYALWGYLTDKADVYSFGVVALEIISGKNNNNYMPSNSSCVCLFILLLASLSAEVLNYLIAGLPFATKWEFYRAC